MGVVHSKTSSMLVMQQFHSLTCHSRWPLVKASLLDGPFSSVVSQNVGTRLRHRSSSLALTRPRLEGPSTCFHCRSLVTGNRFFYICNAPSAPSRCPACYLFVFVICASPGPGSLEHNIAPFLSHVLLFEIETLATTRSYVEVQSDV